jgi:hypothetical protein
MCDHPISRSILQANRGAVGHTSDSEFACKAYATHGPELHRIVTRVLDCPECTEMLVAHTFLALPATRGVQPTLAQLTRSALVFACSALGDSARQQLQQRIRAWHISSITDPGPIEGITTPGRMYRPR